MEWLFFLVIHQIIYFFHGSQGKSDYLHEMNKTPISVRWQMPNEKAALPARGSSAMCRNWNFHSAWGVNWLWIDNDRRLLK